MTHGAKLLRRAVFRQLAFALCTVALISWSVPFLLLLPRELSQVVTLTLLGSLGVGVVIGLALCWARIRRHAFLLSSLPLDQMMSPETKATDLSALARFVDEPARLTLSWLMPQLGALVLFAPPLRPALLDHTTGTTVGMLSSLILATAALPLHVVVRRDFLGVIEQLPQRIMRDMVTEAQLRKTTRGKVHPRLVLAVTTPVIFVALGCALIVNAHLRKADAESRRETARVLARSSLQLAPGDTGGLERAILRAQELGFTAQIESAKARYGLLLNHGGIAELTAPLEGGSATIRFSASTVSSLSLAPVLVSLLAAIAASVLGFFLGNMLRTDLYYATRGVRFLGANPSLATTGTAIIRRARLKIVAELFEAIERLAGRFAMFSQAQENAIDARAAATRMRGLFFASVSHDLKGPLNSILGFTQLVSQETLTRGQRESLDAIHSRAQELLALIETILDAARVEEGQLSLVPEEVDFTVFYDETIKKAKQLCSGENLNIFDELESEVPPLLLDRTRVVRACATLIAYSIRTNAGGKMWIRAERESTSSLRLDIDVPKPSHSPAQIEAMLSPTTGKGQREHRGLALGLRLARSVIELHNGAVRVVDRGKKGAMFCVTLPTAKAPIPTASAPIDSIPPPPESWRPQKEK